MMSYGFPYMLKCMEMRAPEPDPIADKIEAALLAGIDITEAIDALDDLEGYDLEPEEDGGARDARDYGLSENETVYISHECRTCGHVHSCEEIFIS